MKLSYWFFATAIALFAITVGFAVGGNPAGAGTVVLACVCVGCGIDARLDGC